MKNFQLDPLIFAIKQMIFYTDCAIKVSKCLYKLDLFSPSTKDKSKFTYLLFSISFHFLNHLSNRNLCIRPLTSEQSFAVNTIINIEYLRDPAEFTQKETT